MTLLRTKQIKNTMAKIVIDGKSFEGDFISIVNEEVFIDGKPSDGNKYKSIKVIVNGNLKSLDCTSAEINGDVLGNVDATNLTCRAIGGDVDATNVTCDYIEGDVDATNVKTIKK